MNHLIQTQAQLDDLKPLIEGLSGGQAIVAVDTEFLREKTYNAKLCLVQLGIDGNQYCIDVLAIPDLSLLSELFADTSVLKLLHAARQDMEVIIQTLGVLPKPIYDTQLAAAFAGSDMQIGYAGLVNSELDIELPKSQARTDWTKRPLTEKQLAYAADDVTYLHKLYEITLARLNESGKRDWYDQELSESYDVDKYLIKPEVAFQRLSGGNLKLSQQYVLKELATWREAYAQKRDIPRTWVLKDDRLFELAVQQPKTADAVKNLEVLGRRSANRLAGPIAELIKNVTVGEEPLWRRVDPLDKQQRKACSSLMKEVARLAQQHHVAQGLLATRKDIESLYRHRQSKKLLQGWRTQIVGEPLLRYMDSQTES